MPNTLIIPNSGTIFFSTETAGASTTPALTGQAVSLAHDGQAGLIVTSLNTSTSATNRFRVNGANGALLAVTDELTGIVFSVNDPAGLPIISADTGLNDVITIGTFGSNALVVRNDRVGVGTSNPSASAALEIVSTTRGFRPPVMTVAQRTAIAAPAAGLVVYASDAFDLSLYNGTAWGDVLTTHAASFTADTLRTACSQTQGTGSLVFATGPSFTGPVDITLQDATTDNRVMTRGLADARYFTRGLADARYFPIEGLFTNAYKVPLTNSDGGASGLTAFGIFAPKDTTSTFTGSPAVSGSYATWGSSFSRCENSGTQAVLPNGIGLCARISVGSNGMRRAKLLMGGLTAASVLGDGVLNARGFGVEIEADPVTTSQIRFRVIYRNQSSQTILGTWTSYFSLNGISKLILWTYRKDGELRAVYRSVGFSQITQSAWVVIPPVTITAGDTLDTGTTRAKTFQFALEGTTTAYAEIGDIFETHNIFPNL